MIRVEIKDSRVVTDAVREAVRRAGRLGTLSAAARLVQVIKSRLIPAEDPPPVDQRAYSNAWDFEPTATGARVYNDSPHAPVIEYGARAENVKVGRAMIDALAEWAVRKGLVGRGRGSIQARSAEQEAQSFAWAVATNMRKRGIFNRGSEGLGIARKASALAPALVEQEIRAELAELLRK